MVRIPRSKRYRKHILAKGLNLESIFKDGTCLEYSSNNLGASIPTHGTEFIRLFGISFAAQLASGSLPTDVVSWSRQRLCEANGQKRVAITNFKKLP
ncbi:hypothetical protein L5515_005305 [Caenorhabditis briggsae]|uniref:Uncharacterized protein n=1 Tax=Caenorhabditis briggsae TaxID=6238 RepID=A0AAE9EJX2_CAEBR|nr:hypothetical protein L5515_005305 [Caenorhabditis briggsae]